MARVTLVLACGHEDERTLHAEPSVQLLGVYAACPRCRRLHQIVQVRDHDRAPEHDGDRC